MTKRNDLLNVFKALSDETRIRILKLLEEGELCVCDVVAALEMVQPKVSFHLGVLKEAGLIKDRKQGKWIHYRIDDSDIFRRFLILSVLERTPEDVIKEDKKKLNEFLKNKKVKADPTGLKNKSSCCKNSPQFEESQHG
jgi:ArsR family transcriptional regulator